MTDRTTRDSDTGIGRFFEDLRSGEDRRGGGDRRHPREARRPPERRRGAERRVRHERRRAEFRLFDSDERDDILAMLTDPTLVVECPRCGGNLLLSLQPSGDVTAKTVICTDCRGRVEFD